MRVRETGGQARLDVVPIGKRSLANGIALLPMAFLS